MHGDLSQPKRMETLEAFRTESLSILVCSDVAARGIDIDHITHVFNFDVPFNRRRLRSPHRPNRSRWPRRAGPL